MPHLEPKPTAIGILAIFAKNNKSIIFVFVYVTLEIFFLSPLPEKCFVILAGWFNDAFRAAHSLKLAIFYINKYILVPTSIKANFIKCIF